MADSKLSQIEDAQKKPFSANEVRNLLQKDPQTGSYTNVKAYCEKYSEQVKTLYGPNPEEPFRIDLELRLLQIKKLLYYKRIEDGLTNKVEARVEQTTDEVREMIETALGRHTVLSEDELRELRNSDIAHFKSLHIRVDKGFLEDYIDLVRYETEQQLSRIGELTPDRRQLEQEQSTRDIYERASHLLDFIVSHISSSHGAKEQMKAFLVRKMRSPEGVDLIQELYEQVFEGVSSDDPESCQRTIQQMATKLQVSSALEKKRHIREILKNYANDLNVTEEELNAILRPRELKDGSSTYFTDSNGITFHERLAHRLEEIEVATFDIALERMLPAELQTEITLKTYQQKIDDEAKQLRVDILQFRDRYYSIDYVVQKHWSWLSTFKRDRLREGIKALSSIRGQAQHEQKKDDYHKLTWPLLLEISGMKNEADADRILENAEEEVQAALDKEGCPKTQTNELRKADRYFDLFRFYNQRQTAEEKREANERRQLSGFDLNDCLEALQEEHRYTTLGDVKKLIEALADEGIIEEEQRDLILRQLDEESRLDTDGRKFHTGNDIRDEIETLKRRGDEYKEANERLSSVQKALSNVGRLHTPRDVKNKIKLLAYSGQLDQRQVAEMLFY